MGQEILFGLYWIVMVVCGELKESGTDGTRGTVWFVLVSEWWLVVK
jgi:hypothetical protein